MDKYKKNIVFSSLPKTGTLLTLSIIKELTKLESLKVSLDNNYIKKEISKYTKDNNILQGGMNKVTNEEILFSFNFLNKENAIINHALIDISPILNVDEPTLYVGHASPLSMINNKDLQKIEKKIFVYRYGLDVLNSKMKFIENLDYTLYLNSLLKSHDKYQELRYLTPDKVLKTINDWEIYNQGYVDNKDKIYGIKYESLLSNPEEEIQKLADYLEIDISKDKIEEIISKLFFKELGKLKNTHVDYQHYNNAPKIGEWQKFLPFDFYKEFEDRNKSLLMNLSYDIGKIEKYEDNSFHKIFRRKMNLFLSHNNDENSENVFSFSSINALKQYLRNKKVIVYGNTGYSKFVLSNLDETTKVVLIYEDKINPQVLLNSIWESDYILTMEYPENQEKIDAKIKKILRLHGGIEKINCYNLSYYNYYKKQKENDD